MGQWGGSSTEDATRRQLPAGEAFRQPTRPGPLLDPAPVEWVTVPGRTTPTEQEEMFEVVVLLRRAGATLDRLWADALTSGAGRAAVRFGEASHGVHRALIALDDGGYDAAASRQRRGADPAAV